MLPISGSSRLDADKDPWLHSFSGKSVPFVLLMDAFDKKQKQHERHQGVSYTEVTAEC